METREPIRSAASATRATAATAATATMPAGRRTARWRFGNRLLSRDVVSGAFRYLGAERAAAGTLSRFTPVGIPRADGAATLARITSWETWAPEWEALATRCLMRRDSPTQEAGQEAGGTAAGRAGNDGGRRAAWDLSREAALALYVAQLFVTDVPAKRALHLRAAALYREIAPALDPPALPFALTFRGAAVPGYLSLPPCAPGADSAHPAPLVVLLNGGSTSKEELNGWRDPFLARGFATLALDNPGTGESWGVAHYVPNQHALLDDLRRAVAAHSALDGRIALIGVSLGGMLAVDLATEAPDLAAVVTVTAPFAPGEYVVEMAPLTQWEIAHVTGFPEDCLPYLCSAVSLAPRAPRLHMPTLVIGAGRDWIVPPDESRRLYAALVPPHTLHWYPRGSHCVFSHLPLMLTHTARWLARVVPR